MSCNECNKKEYKILQKPYLIQQTPCVSMTSPRCEVLMSDIVFNHRPYHEWTAANNLRNKTTHFYSKVPLPTQR